MAVVLEEIDIPGACLHGRRPYDLTVNELKRWLACRGASRSGNKADLIKRVEGYIKGGLDSEVQDPDGGANIERKLKKLSAATGSDSAISAQTVTFPDDGWTASLSKLPDVKFPSIYRHFMETSIVGSARSCLGSAASESDSESELFTSFKGIDKGYNFFKSRHVCDIQMVHHADYSYVRANVRPSMKKCDPYKTKVCLYPDGMVKLGRCTCTAGLGGCCNHVAALLYALEEFVRFGLRSEDESSPTSRLCKWNQPRSRRMEPQRVADIRLRKPTLATKRSYASRAEYNPVPPNKRVLDPEQLVKLRADLQSAHEYELGKDKSGNVERYGSSTLLTALDVEWGDSDCDDSSSGSSSSDESTAGEQIGDDNEEPVAAMTSAFAPSLQFSSVDDFYKKEVAVDAPAIKRIEEMTRDQSSTTEWFLQRRCRVTASVFKNIVCRRSSDFSPLIRRKLCGDFSGNKATRYGLKNEKVALDKYVSYQQQKDPAFTCKPSGLVISSELPWLAASPDGVAESSADGTGLVEVKCPYSCRNITLEVACKKSSFSLQPNGVGYQLKRSHSYYFQVQLQLHVTRRLWADYVLWTPSEFFVERIAYDQAFMEKHLQKAKSFYFDHFLPAVFAEAC